MPWPKTPSPRSASCKWPNNYQFTISFYMTDQEKPAVEQKVKNALAQIRPYLQQDGGDVEYVDMTAEGVVIVRLKGHCGSCPHAMQTLKQGIEQAIKKVIPEVKSVEKI